MTEPSTPRPVPGPARALPGDAAAPGTPAEEQRFAGLADRPVAEHAEVFEAEHERLHTDLGTIDRV